MFDYLRTHDEKDINSTNLGKQRSWKLARGERVFAFKGRLLGFYHASGDSLEPEAQNKTHLRSIAIFKTHSRYIIRYLLEFINNEHQSGHQTHIHATDSLDQAERFIQAMTYANRKAFVTSVVDDARATEAGQAG